MTDLNLKKQFHKHPSAQRLILAAWLGLLLALISPAAGLAQQPTPSDDEVNAVAREMYCPVCENIPLDVCPTQACAQWRELIRQKLAEGWSKAQIEDYFVAQYGDRVLAEPPRRGLNWLVYIAPPLFILLGIYLLARIYRSTESKSPQPLPLETQDEIEYLKRVDAEVKKLE